MAVAFFDNFDELRRRMPEPDSGPYWRTIDWFSRLHAEGMPSETPLLLGVSATPDGAALCLPLIERPSCISSLSNYYTPLWAPLTWQEDRLDVMAHAEMLGRALRARPTRPASVHLHPLATGPMLDAVRLGFKSAGYLCDEHFAFGNWYLPTAHREFAEHYSGRPSRLRNTIARARRRLDKAGDWNIRIHRESGADMTAAIDAFETIYRHSWKPAETYPAFVRSLCQWAVERGMLRLGVLSLNARPIASQIWLFDKGSASIFKLAYEPDAARFSPGSVLTAALMEYSIDRDHADEIDYLSGDDDYKRDWMTHRRTRVGLIAFDPRSPRGLLAAMRHFGGRIVRPARTVGAT